MSSNSIRVSDELFGQAKQDGELLTRSAAQQVEYWARLGRALEQAGLTVDEFRQLMDQARAKGKPKVKASSDDLWARKREAQARDIEDTQAGRSPAVQMTWFRPGQGRTAKVLNAPY